MFRKAAFVLPLLLSAISLSYAAEPRDQAGGEAQLRLRQRQSEMPRS